jgi:hypothetical protein
MDSPGPYLERPEVLAACKQSSIDIRQPINVDEMFIGSEYLNYLAGSQNDQGQVLHPSLNQVVRYALEKGLTALETDVGSNSHWDGFGAGQIVRITVKPAHSPACKAFRYPWSEMPKLRRLGLSPDHCVAVEKLDAPTVRTRLQARPTQVFRVASDGDREWFALWRIEVSGVLDVQQQVQPAIRVVDHVARSQGGGKGYSGWGWGCPDGNVRAKALDAAISGRGNPWLLRPDVVVVPAPVPAVQETGATDADIAQLRWLERGRCAGGGITYDAAGTVWIADLNVGNIKRQALHVVKGHQLLIAPMPAQFDWGGYYNHSALLFKGGFAVNLTRSFKNDDWRRLAVFDAKLRHVATWKLSQQQMDSLMPPEPATINGCTDPYNDQFQRSPSAPMTSR